MQESLWMDPATATSRFLTPLRGLTQKQHSGTTIITWSYSVKRGDLLKYDADGSLWIVEWADDKYVKIVGITHAVLIEYSGLEIVNEDW
jgi:hypothetical protein